MAVRTRVDPQGRRRYDIEFQQRGRRVFERCPPDTTLSQARERETALRRGTYDADTLGHQPEILLSEAIQAWLNTRPHKHHRNLVNKANQLAPFVAGKRLSEAPEVAQMALVAWSSVANVAQERPMNANGGLQSSTINRRLAVLKAALTFHNREDLSRRIRLRREQNGREVYLSKDELKRLEKFAPFESLRAAIMIAVYSGLRASELLAIATTPTSTQVDSLLVPMSKSGKSRVVPVPRLLRPYLRALPLGLDYWQLQRGFLAARKAAGRGGKIAVV